MTKFFSTTNAVLFTILTIIMPAIYLFGKIKKNKLTIPCVGCDKGSFWYKCAPGTGYGSTGCDFAKGLSSMVSTIKNIISSIAKAFSSVFSAVMKSIKAAREGITKLFNSLTPNLDQIDLSGLSSKNFRNKLPKCDVPVVGDVCKPAWDALASAYDALLSGIRGAIGLINSAIKAISDGFSQLGKVMSKALSAFWKLIVAPFEPIIELIQQPINEGKELIKNIKATDIISLIIYQILNLIQTIFPFLSPITIVILAVIMFLGPLIGGLFGFLLFSYRIISLISQLFSSFFFKTNL